MTNKKNSKPTKFENNPKNNTVAPKASKLCPKGMTKAKSTSKSMSY